MSAEVTSAPGVRKRKSRHFADARNFVIVKSIALYIVLCGMFGIEYTRDERYVDFLEKGYYGDLTTSVSNPLTILGTLSTGLSAILIPVLWTGRLNFVTKTLSVFLITSLFINLIDGTDLDVLKSLLRAFIYIFAMDGLIRAIPFRNASIAVLGAILSVLIPSLILSATDEVFRVSLGTFGFRGLFSHKNIFGAFCLFSLILATPLTLIGRDWKWASATLLLIVAALLSQSVTSTLLGIAVVILGIASRARLTRDIIKGIFSTGLIAAFVTLFTPAMMVYLFHLFTGSTFTGRTASWGNVIKMFYDRPFLGIGSKALSDFQALTRIPIDSSIVFILGSSGIVGIVVYLFSLGALIMNAGHLRSRFTPFFVFGVMAFFVYGFTEKGGIPNSGYPTMALVILGGLMEKSVRSAVTRRKQTTQPDETLAEENTALPASATATFRGEMRAS